MLEAWTGPQVAWKMARGGPGAFGGKKINSYPVWLALLRRVPARPRRLAPALLAADLDLVMLLSFSVSLWFFNHGEHLRGDAARLPGPRLAARCAASGSASATVPPRGSTVWPVWLLIGATVFLAGFRIGLNVRDSNVIDVGLSGVIGAQRIATGESPYGNFPIEGNRPACGPADSYGEIRDRIQTNGRCEAADAQGDTYGPVSYEAYLPGYWVFGWSGKWDTLAGRPRDLDPLGPALPARACGSSAWRFGGARLGGDARVRLGRLAVHAVLVELEHERHDPAGAAALRLLLPDLARRCAARSARSGRS